MSPRHIAAIFPLWILLLLAAPARAVEPTPLLVLHSYSQEYPWTLGQHHGFMAALNADKARAYDVSVEYLDTKRIAYTPAYGDLSAAFFRDKYRGFRPAAVYVTDDNALKFALSHLDAIFPGVPVFFSGVNDYGVKSRLDPSRVSGVFEKKEIGPNLALMRAIAAHNRQITIVGDASDTYRAIEEEVQTELSSLPDLDAVFISTNRLAELTSRLRQQKSRFVFLTTLGAVADAHGRTLTLRETISAIVQAGDFIVFSMEDAYLLPGVLGGYVTSGPRQGRAAAGLLRRYLNGESLARLPPIETSPNEYIVDDLELGRTGLVLPPAIAAQTIHVNVPPGFYAANRSIVLGTLYALGSMLLLGGLAALFLYVRNNRQIAITSQQLEDSKNGLDLAQRIAQMGNWDWRIPEGRLHWSDGMYRVLGVMPEASAASHETFMSCTHPDDSPAVGEALRQALSGTATYDIEHRIVRPGGEIRFVREAAEIQRDPAGAAVRVIGTIQDITASKALEQELRDSEARYRLILESAAEGFWMIDAERKTSYVNSALCQMLGYAREEMIGRPPMEFADKENRRIFRDQMARIPDSPHRYYEIALRHKDGRTIPLYFQATTHFDVNGRVRLSFAFITDLTERKTMDAELRAHRDRLEELVTERTIDLEAARAAAERLTRVKSEFLANMSHEVRTPLNAVLGLARMGVRDSFGRQAADTFTRILDSGKHLLGVINDILDISKFEAGKLTVERQSFDLTSVIANAHSFVAGAAEQKGLACKVTAGPDLPQWVTGDAQRLQQVLVNLLSNAVKFTEDGEVRLRVAHEGDDIYFRVIDTGVGITPEQMARLFTPFEQGDASTTRKFGGTGLGLAISRNLARLMGGDITVDSHVGEGSAFTLHLPLPVAAPAVAEPAPVAGGLRLYQIRVLAAEDVGVNRLILEDLLVHEGAQVRFAENGLQAVEQVERAGADAFDVVLMDVQMPEMDGYQATQRIQEITPRLPVIGLTAHAMPEERQRCYAAGMVDHVSKPIDTDRLVAAVLRYVGPAARAIASRGAQADRCGAPKGTGGYDGYQAGETGEREDLIIDWAALRQRYGGRQAFIDKLTTTACHSIADSIDKLRNAVEACDSGAVAFVAHSLKGAGGNLSAHRFYALAADTENAARAGRDDFAILATSLAEMADSMLAELRLAERRGESAILEEQASPSDG